MLGKYIELTPELLASTLYYEKETGLFRKLTNGHKYKIGDVCGFRDRKGYIRILLFGKIYMAHRLAWLYENKKWPDDLIDHINGVRDDNRIDNLREVNNSKNLMNSRKRCSCSSKYKGVCWYRSTNKWTAQIMINGKRKRIGYFKSERVAAYAYDIFALKHYGEYANTNFIKR